DWRATLLRVASFRRAIIATDQRHDVESRIEFDSGEPGRFQIDRLEVSSPGGCTKLAETRAEIKRGERVVIVGEAGTGKTVLFRALAGLWRWGSGRIVRPQGEAVHYMPRTPYLPPGTLREALAYPSKVEDFKAPAYAAALTRLGRKSLVPLLDHPGRWDQDLSEEEQLCVALARALLHAPPWLVIDEVLDRLDPDMLAQASEVLANDLGQSGLVYIGRSEVNPRLFKRTLHLIKDEKGRKLARR